MTKFCPFMSTNPSILEKKLPLEKTVPCMDTCALYFKGHCSINVLAQTQYEEYMKKYGTTGKVPADDCQQ